MNRDIYPENLWYITCVLDHSLWYKTVMVSTASVIIKRIDRKQNKLHQLNYYSGFAPKIEINHVKREIVECHKELNELHKLLDIHNEYLFKKAQLDRFVNKIKQDRKDFEAIFAYT